VEEAGLRISHYLYNAFVLDSGAHRIAIDPGGLFFYYFRFTTLIPEPDWPGLTHVLVTHADPDHYWHADRVAAACEAKVVCNETMVRDVGGDRLALGPRDRGLAFTTRFPRLRTLRVGETIDVDGVVITGLATTHGPLTLRLGPFSKTVRPGPDERIGWGAIGFDIDVGGTRVVNLGDTLLEEDAWTGARGPDVLMVPIGGGAVGNTMDERDALRAVEILQPKLVIPCHYNCPAFFTRAYCPADEALFVREAERLGVACRVLRSADAIEV
jgi:L-ascorbate metabolism protein UlaG (beta-lactamase superfamily)